jgi:hypothetical protein
MTKLMFNNMVGDLLLFIHLQGKRDLKVNK